MNYQHYTGCLLDLQRDALEQQTSQIQILEGGDKTREREVCDVFVNIDWMFHSQISIQVKLEHLVSQTPLPPLSRQVRGDPDVPGHGAEYSCRFVTRWQLLRCKGFQKTFYQAVRGDWRLEKLCSKKGHFCFEFERTCLKEIIHSKFQITKWTITD